MSKRYKVVQDASLEWGILDTAYLDLGHARDAFASWGLGYVQDRGLQEMVGWATKLNHAMAERDEFSWSEYEPSKNFLSRQKRIESLTSPPPNL